MSATASSVQEFLSFRVADQEYGLPVLQVQEIRSVESTVRLPGSNGPVLGVLDLRGRIVPIFDARGLLGLAPTQETGLAVHIICRNHDRLVGLLVDEVLDVVALQADEIKCLPATGVDASQSALKRIAQAGQRHLLLTEVGALLGQTPKAEEAALLLAA